MKGHVEIGYLTKIGALRLNRVIILETRFKIHTDVCNFMLQHPQKPYELLIFFTTSVILKMAKHSDFRISSLLVVDALRILQFNRKTEKYRKEFIRFWGTLSQNYRRLYRSLTMCQES